MQSCCFAYEIYCFLTFSLLSHCWISKTLIFPANQVMSFDVFDAGVTWMHMLDGKANSHLQ